MTLVNHDTGEIIEPLDRADQHINEIVASHEVKRTRPAPHSGLTDRSARSLP